MNIYHHQARDQAEHFLREQHVETTGKSALRGSYYLKNLKLKMSFTRFL